MQAQSTFENVSKTDGLNWKPLHTSVSDIIKNDIEDALINKVEKVVHDKIDDEVQTSLKDIEYFLMTPAMKMKMNKLKVCQGNLRTTSTACLIASAVFSMLALAAISAGTLLSIPAAFVGVLLLYPGYNAFQVSTNLNQPLNVPIAFIKKQLPLGLDDQKMKEALSKHTVGFGYFIDHFLKKL